MADERLLGDPRNSKIEATAYPPGEPPQDIVHRRRRRR